MPINISPAPMIQTTVYGQFKGVDLSVDASLVSSSRSPYAPNLKSDLGGFPEKRIGWQTLFSLGGKVHNMWRGIVNNAEKESITVNIAHVGSSLYTFTQNIVEAPVIIKSGVPDTSSVGYFMRDVTEDKVKFWFIAGGSMYAWNYGDAVEVDTIAYTPTTIIAREPTGGGEMLEPVNLIQPNRKEKYKGDGSAKEYQLGSKEITKVVKIELEQDDGTAKELLEGADFSADLLLGKVVFKAPPPKPALVGEDNVFITYARVVEGYADRIKHCNVSTIYGSGGDLRVFLTCNYKHANKDWWSETNNPSYFPDINYAIIGSESSAIMGYSKIGEQLAIVKDGVVNQTSIYLRNVMEFNNDIAFPVKQGITGIGAISSGSFTSLVDEPLFLTPMGICAIASSSITSERVIQNRSFFINQALAKEKNHQDAVATEWEGMYLLSFPDSGNVYVLDSRHTKTYLSQSQSDYIYDCYTWNNIPATAWLMYDNTLIYGTNNGDIRIFKTHIDNMSRYSDDDIPIKCAWATPNDNDGATNRLKTMQKRGCYCTIKPFARSSATVYFAVDGNALKPITSSTMDIFDWEDIDFERLTFNSNESPQEIFFNKKVKKYKRLQIVIVNEELNEGFGIFEIGKTFTTGGLAKR